LAAVCAAIFGQTLWHDFVSYDDSLYVFENAHVKAGLSWANIAWAVTTQTANYVHPLTWLSHMLDCELYGLHPWGHHLTNLLLHTLGTVLLFLVLLRMTGRRWPAAFVAALFAVHPLHVESVAWIAERKGVLSMFFWVAALGGYAWYRQRPNAVRYLVMALLFLLGLMSKPMVVTLPFVLLLLDYWPLNRLDRSGSFGGMARGTVWLVVEKIPLFLLTALFCMTTFLMQAHGNNLSFGEKLPLAARCANAVVVYVLYLAKTLWPSGLAVYYPHPLARPMGQVAGAAVILALITLLCLCNVRRRPYLAVGWFWYLGTLLPVIQLVQIGTFSHADRYTYIPLVGIFIMVAWSLDEVRSRGPRCAQLVTVGAVLALAALSCAAFRQTGYWKDSQALFQRDLAVAGSNAVAHDSLGVGLVEHGNLDDARQEFELALKADPHDATGLFNMGVVMESLNQPAEAESYYRRTLYWKPGHPKAHNNLAGILARVGRLDEALTHCRKAIELAPELADPHNNMGNLMAAKGEWDEALKEYGIALKMDPAQTSVRLNLANVLIRLRRFDEARKQLDAVFEIEPKNEVGRSLMVQLEAVQAEPFITDKQRR